MFKCIIVNVVRVKWIRALMRSVMSMLIALHTKQPISVSVDLATKEQVADARVCHCTSLIFVL